MRDEGSVYRVIATALSVAVTIIIMLVAAWAVDVSRRIQGLEDRQRDVLIRLRAVEYFHDRNYPPSQ